MKNILWIVKTEIQQAKLYFLFLFLISMTLGSSLRLIEVSESKIKELSSQDIWGADLAVVPKGITLIDFKREILAGHSSSLLPEAIYDTTLSLSNGQFEATALLTLQGPQGGEVMFKGNSSVGLDWLRSKVTPREFHEQNVYQTPEWGRKVISGFFVKGSPAAMKSLKDLIDRRTVAQAIIISQQVLNDEKNQNQLQEALNIYSGVMLGMILLSMSTVFMWLRNRLSSSLRVFNEIGFSKNQTLMYFLSLSSVFFAFPSLFGYLVTLQIFIL